MSKIIWRSITVMLATSLFSGVLLAETPGNYFSYEDLDQVAEIVGPYFFSTGSAAPAFESVSVQCYIVTTSNRDIDEAVDSVELLIRTRLNRPDFVIPATLKKRAADLEFTKRKEWIQLLNENPNIMEYSDIPLQTFIKKQRNAFILMSRRGLSAEAIHRVTDRIGLEASPTINTLHAIDRVVVRYPFIDNQFKDYQLGILHAWLIAYAVVTQDHGTLNKTIHTTISNTDIIQLMDRLIAEYQ